MTEPSDLPPWERAKRYRELAYDARQVRLHSARAAYAAAPIKAAGKYEQLAAEADEEAKAAGG